MSIRINKVQPTQNDLSDYEKKSVPVSITLPIAQVPAQDPSLPAEPASESPPQPSAPKPAEPSS
jgi:hypothetical protein